MQTDRTLLADGLIRRGLPMGAPGFGRYPLRSRWQRHASAQRAALVHPRRWGTTRTGFLGL